MIEAVPSKEIIQGDPTSQVLGTYYLLIRDTLVMVPSNVFTTTWYRSYFAILCMLLVALVGTLSLVGKVTREPTKDGTKKETFLDFLVSDYLRSNRTWSTTSVNPKHRRFTWAVLRLGSKTWT